MRQEVLRSCWREKGMRYVSFTRCELLLFRPLLIARASPTEGNSHPASPGQHCYPFSLGQTEGWQVPMGGQETLMKSATERQARQPGKDFARTFLVGRVTNVHLSSGPVHLPLGQLKLTKSQAKKSGFGSHIDTTDHYVAPLTFI